MRQVEIKREEMLAKRIQISRQTSERRESMQQKQQDDHDASIHKVNTLSKLFDEFQL